MSEFRGKVTCPHCGEHHFVLENWDTYVSLWCVGCTRVVREIVATHLPMGITVVLPGGRK
jgi:ribosomal protein S27E